MFRWLRFLFKKLYNKKTRCDLETVFYYAKKCNSSHVCDVNSGISYCYFSLDPSVFSQKCLTKKLTFYIFLQNKKIPIVSGVMEF